MGPPAFAGGNKARLSPLLCQPHASMGPPAFAGGNMGRGRGGASEGQASMGPPAFAGGNFPPFGGVPPLHCASMGPPAFAGGNLQTEMSLGQAGSGFNGATGFRRWKPAPDGPGGPGVLPLQWGHRLSPVETIWRTAHSERPSVASMGPPAFAGGNGTASRLAIMNGCGLQWGHRLSPVETEFPHHGIYTGPYASMGPPAFAGGNRRRRE